MGKPIGVEGDGIAIGLVALKYWYSCGAEYIGVVGLVGEWIPKSMLPRVLKLPVCCCVVPVEVVLADAVEFLRVWVFGSCEPTAGGDFAIGKDMPRSLPRLATPTPQVRVVR
jgi:hypothetical protein